MDFGPAPSPRRASCYLDVTSVREGKRPLPSLFHSAYLLHKKGSDPSAVLGTREVDDQALGRCLEPVEQVLGELEVPVKFEVRGDGHAVHHTATWLGSGSWKT